MGFMDKIMAIFKPKKAEDEAPPVKEEEPKAEEAAEEPKETEPEKDEESSEEKDE